MVQAYWQIGERIVRGEIKYKDKVDYGNYLIKKLGPNLFIKERLLYRIVNFIEFIQLW